MRDARCRREHTWQAFREERGAITTTQEDSTANTATCLRVIDIDCDTDPRWAALVDRLPHAFLFHHPAWLRVLEASFGYVPVHLACEDANGRLCGVLPLFRQRGLVTGCRLSSLPRTPVGGPVAESDQALRLLMQSAVERVRDEPGSNLQIKTRSPALEHLAAGLIRVPWRESYSLRLPEKPEQLSFGSARNNARIKWAVKRAISLGVHVREAESSRDLREWYSLYLETMRWYFVPPKPLHFFMLAWEELRRRGMLRLLLAEQVEAGRVRLLAGSIFLMSGQTVFYAFNGRRREDLSLHPNDLLQWQAIHDACVAGYREYDLGEVTRTHPQLAQFKKKWGARPDWLYRYYYPQSRELGIGLIESRSRTGRVAAELWKRVPLPATAVLGVLAHRYF